MEQYHANTYQQWKKVRLLDKILHYSYTLEVLSRKSRHAFHHKKYGKFLKWALAGRAIAVIQSTIALPLDYVLLLPLASIIAFAAGRALIDDNPEAARNMVISGGYVAICMAGTQTARLHSILGLEWTHHPRNLDRQRLDLYDYLAEKYYDKAWEEN